MRQNLTVDLVRRLIHTPPPKAIDIYDAQQPRLVLRARPSGQHAYRLTLGRGRWYSLGSVSAIPSPAKARLLAQQQLGEYASGRDPRVTKRRQLERSSRAYLTDVYAPWLTAHRRRPAETIARLDAMLAQFSAHKLSGISAWDVERWRTARLKVGRRPATINRDLGALRAMLTRAVDWGHIAHHPLAKVKALKEDKTGRLRYLLPDEEARLREALRARDDERRAERESANAWRRERGYDEWSSFGEFTDRLHPMVLLALNTGLRFGELCALSWSDIDVPHALLTVRSENAKSGKTRYVPLNLEALKTLTSWRRSPAAGGTYVFGGRDETKPLIDIKTSWMRLLRDRARIQQFRFHDLRHTFASKLVMAGVDLNTVRELLGHADIKMTLRYAHLAAEHKAAAVARLVLAT